MHRRFSHTGLLAMLAVMAVLPPACRKKEVPVDNPVVVNKALYDTSSNFYVEFDQYPDEKRNLPIGIYRLV